MYLRAGRSPTKQSPPETLAKVFPSSNLKGTWRVLWVNEEDSMINLRFLTLAVLLAFLLAGCSGAPVSCPPQMPEDLSMALAYEQDAASVPISPR